MRHIPINHSTYHLCIKPSSECWAIGLVSSRPPTTIGSAAHLYIEGGSLSKPAWQLWVLKPKPCLTAWRMRKTLVGRNRSTLNSYFQVWSLLSSVFQVCMILHVFLASAHLTITPTSECPFLQGRGFVFASQYAKLLPTQLAGQYLDAAVQVIEADNAGIPVKISAVKAVHK